MLLNRCDPPVPECPLRGVTPKGMGSLTSGGMTPETVGKSAFRIELESARVKAFTFYSKHESKFNFLDTTRGS